MSDHDLTTRTEGEGETLDMPEGMKGFSPGQVLGERYQILEMLGRGGMGEVWHAFDLKLRVEVALKALRQEFFRSDRRLELLRQEVRAAREVVSPNVCRIFDLIEVEGRELVSMEYVDGATLLGVLQERGPLELKEAQDIASQFLAGLEAIHKAGLIHRDIKPENIMLTRAGRVVVMDFGLARQETEGGGTVSGTPAYMSPEQAAGQTLDARADVYAAGVVLAEMVSPEGIKSFDSRQSVWEGVRSEPAEIPDTPWAPVIQQAVKKDREGRFNSAHTLTRALEDVTLRVEGADDLHPYPGLASFTEADAEYFFGREAEIEQMWRKLEGPPRMLALIGPSGAGKSSFVRAGLFPSSTTQWATALCKPGNNPQLGLGRALAPEMTGDADVMDLLLRFDNPDVAVEVLSRWRRRTERALLVVDQFEELFTQNSSEVQRRFADLLNRLVLEADVHVLLSMRDDFMIRCRDFEALQPTFADVTGLPTLSGDALRRALTQPALQCGYRFEDDELVDEMLGEVEGERGALPLLAFAAARLWEWRDKESGLLTRGAYHDIGGVAGALAQHAEATIDHIGVERIPIVRELLRNLVTVEGTRAVREWTELLSIFDAQQLESAEDVLRELIDARLLTSYEIHEDEHEPTRRVEIIHESLLANWPRLVRWQTQDADAAQLRDQLRQAARTWDEHARTDDTLWTGSAYREFAVWRERYPGGLSELEEAFAEAMKLFATKRRRRRRIAVSAAFAVLVIVLSVVAVLWQQSVREALRADAATLLSQAQVELESYPSAAVAYAAASIELSDGLEARRLAMEALWKGPTAFVVREDPSYNIAFTGDGQWLVQTTDAPSYDIHVIGADGTDVTLDDIHGGRVFLGMDPESGLFWTGWKNRAGWYALWSAPERRLIAKGHYDPLPEYSGAAYDLSRKRLLLWRAEDDRLVVDALKFDGSLEPLGALAIEVQSACWLPPNSRWFAVSDDKNVYVIEFGDHGLSEPQRIEQLEGQVDQVECDPLGRFVAARYEDSQIRIWWLDGRSQPAVIQGPSDERPHLRFANDGSLLEVLVIDRETGRSQTWIYSLETQAPTLLRHIELGKAGGAAGWALNPVKLDLVSILNPDPNIRLWPLNVPADAEPIVIRRGDAGLYLRLSIQPQGSWFATSGSTGLTLWPLAQTYPTVIERYEERTRLVFGPEGRWFATGSVDGRGTIRLWQLEGDGLPPARILHEAGSMTGGLAASPDGEQILLAHPGGVQLLPVGGAAPRTLANSDSMGAQFFNAAFSGDGHRAAASGTAIDRSIVIVVWDLDSEGEPELVDLGDDAKLVPRIGFTGNGDLLSGNDSGLLRWDLETGKSETLFNGGVGRFAISPDDSRVLLVRASGQSTLDSYGPALVLDLETGSTTPLTSHGDRVTAVAMDAAGRIAVTGDEQGTLRVGLITGEEPHLLLGSPEDIVDLAVDPKGRWIASTSGTEVRLWPMPDLSKPPLHTLPREELIAKLKTLTNLRVVRDPESSTGWTLTHDPFPGWETVPTW